MTRTKIVAVLCISLLSCRMEPPQEPILSKGSKDSLDSLAADFFVWRAKTQPCTGDDIPRVERPDGWVPNVSASDLNDIKKNYLLFENRLQSIPKQNWTRKDSVDFLLLRSAIERINWEMSVLRTPYRNPDFYVHQTLGAVYELLLISSPMTDRRMENILARLRSFPGTIKSAKENLSQAVQPFAEIALENLKGVRGNLNKTRDALKKLTSEKYFLPLDSATDMAAKTLEDYTIWLDTGKTKMQQRFNVGRDAYNYFVKKVALIPYASDDMLQQGRQEWDRSVAFEAFEMGRSAGLPDMPMFETIEDQISQEEKDESAIRKFLEDKNILSVPDWVGHYRNRPMPAYLRPLAFMGVPDDLTSDSRLNENAFHYIPNPSPHLSFFYLASAKDPRPIIVHEGVPGHYFQLVRSWKNPDPIRRHFFDSGANEGIGFYVEEMLLQSGLFDNKPRSRQIIYRFMRLRALRVEVDIQLALGNFSVEDAGAYLSRTVPMDPQTAMQEARFFAYNPGQAISYQIGKLQIHKFLSDSKMRKEDFSLRDFHDFLMVNGNVPIALQRFEYLGLDDEIKKLW